MAVDSLVAHMRPPQRAQAAILARRRRSVDRPGHEEHGPRESAPRSVHGEGRASNPLGVDDGAMDAPMLFAAAPDAAGVEGVPKRVVDPAPFPRLAFCVRSPASFRSVAMVE